VTPKGCFWYRRVPVGIKTGSSVLPRARERLLGDLEEFGVKSYFDDILICNKNKEQHYAAIKMVLDRFRRSGFIALDKTFFVRKD